MDSRDTFIKIIDEIIIKRLYITNPENPRIKPLENLQQLLLLLEEITQKPIITYDEYKELKDGFLTSGHDYRNFFNTNIKPFYKNFNRSQVSKLYLYLDSNIDINIKKFKYSRQK